MSYPKNLLLSHSEIPIKTFVKEKDEPSSSICIQKKSEFKSLDGNELKKVYEEIISEKNKESVNNNLKLPSSKKTAVKKRKINYEKNVSNVEHVTERNVNVIFKSIESGDKNFVFQSINSENVNILDQFGWTPLMAAAAAGFFEIVKFLLDIGANVKIKDKSGFTATHIALKKNHSNIVNLIENYKKEQIISNNKKLSVKKEQKKESKDEAFYCNICKINFTESSKKKHETSILHTFNCDPKLGSFYGISKANKGYQMLLNTGWNEEGGLGPSGEGQKYPVKTVLKRDRKGLGVSENKTARITHFNPNDPSAVETVKKHKKRIFKAKERKFQLKKEAQRDRALRKEIS